MQLRVFKQDGQRAPHKPMMILWAIGQCLAGKPRLIPYREAAPGYSSLMRRFGPRKTTNPEYPFWRLRRDEIWEVENAGLVKQNLTEAGDAKVTYLHQHNIRAGFIEPIYQAFSKDPNFAMEIASILIASQFENTSLSDDVFKRIGIEVPIIQRDRIEIYRRRRDLRFRISVLEAYDNKCAVCKGSLWMDEELIGIEAAHVRWHAEEGLDHVSNGIAMCALHHSLFDYGAFTLSLGYRIIVAENLTGDALHDWIGRFGHEKILVPEHSEPPRHSNLTWHHHNVFKEDPRTIQMD